MIDKILVADDETDVVSIIQKRLVNQGYQVWGAENGKQALDMTILHIPDLIVTDVTMPIMNGLEFCKAVKNNCMTKDIPIIVVTGHGSTQDSFTYLGIKDFLVKPFKLDHLQTKIMHSLAISRMTHTQKTKIIFHSSTDKTLQVVATLMDPVSQWVPFLTNSAVDLKNLAQRVVPDVIIFDLLMKDSSVEDLVKSIKANTELSKTVILIYYSPFDSNKNLFSLQAAMIEIQYLKSVVLAAGAKGYLGVFNPKSILDQLNDYRKDWSFRFKN